MQSRPEARLRAASHAQHLWSSPQPLLQTRHPHANVTAKARRCPELLVSLSAHAAGCSASRSTDLCKTRRSRVRAHSTSHNALQPSLLIVCEHAEGDDILLSVAVLTIKRD